MFVTLLLLLGVGAVKGRIECSACVLYDSNMTSEDGIQWKGFGSFRWRGTTKQINVAQAKRNGIILRTGQVCKTVCEGYGGHNIHICMGEDIHKGFQYCAPYNKDQYGRKCERVEKRSRDVFCYVENGNSYWLHEGGSSGDTHYPICVSDNRICMPRYRH